MVHCNFLNCTFLFVYNHLFAPLYIKSSKLIPDIGMMVRVFANGLGDLGSIPGRVIPKTQKNGT